MLWSDCLKEKPWHEFPFSGLVAMFSAIITMMVDSLATSVYTKKCRTTSEVVPGESSLEGGEENLEMGAVNLGHFHGHHHAHHETKMDGKESQLLRYRVVAMVRLFDSCKSNTILLLTIVSISKLIMGIYPAKKILYGNSGVESLTCGLVF